MITDDGIRQRLTDAVVNENNGAPASTLQNLLRSRPGLDASQQIAIYRNSMRGAMTTALSDIYPVCKKLVGTRFFHAMAQKYIGSHPSRSPDLADYGISFPAFVRSFKPAGALVYLADIARLEWAWHRAFHAADSHALDPERLSRIPQEPYPSVIFQPAPGSALLKSPFPIRKIWLSNQTDEDSQIELCDGCNRLLVVRVDYDIQILELDPAQWRFMRAIGKRQPFHQLCEQLESMSAQIPGLLETAIRQRWITDFKTGDPS